MVLSVATQSIHGRYERDLSLLINNLLMHARHAITARPAKVGDPVSVLAASQSKIARRRRVGSVNHPSDIPCHLTDSATG